MFKVKILKTICKQDMNEAHAKINLVLDVTGIRPDGYHEVKMIMQELSLHDDVTVTKLPGEEITITVHGGAADIPADSRNIAVKAALLMKKTFGISGGFHIDLIKRIPSAAGLAGGSADAAAVMKAVNTLCGLGKTDRELSELAVSIGADVPYCVLGGTALSEGIGEILRKISPMPTVPVLLVKPSEGVSTKEIYMSLDAVFDTVHHPDVEACMEDIAAGDLRTLRRHTGNVLEEVTAGKVPAVREIEEFLYTSGAVLSMMSGSGPTVFGIFETEEKLSEAMKKTGAAFPGFEILCTST